MVRIMIVNVIFLLVKLLWMDPGIYLCSQNLFCSSIHLGIHHPFVHWTKYMGFAVISSLFLPIVSKTALQVLSLSFWRVKSVTPAKDLKSLSFDSLIYIPSIRFIQLYFWFLQSNVWFFMTGICFYFQSFLHMLSVILNFAATRYSWTNSVFEVLSV